MKLSTIFSMIGLLSVLLLVQPSEAQILLTTQNTINVRGQIDAGSMAEVKMKLFKLNLARGSSQYPIYLVMNTPGGSVVAAEGLVQFARSFRNVETITLEAASAGASIVQGIQGKRHILPNGTMMFHRAQVGIQGQVNEGEVESRLAYIKSILLQEDARTANRLGISVEEFKRRAKDEYWLYGIKAVVDRAADDVVGVSCTTQLVNRTTTQTISFGPFGSAEFEISDCPTIN